jgi:hypothetical protein
VRWAPFIQQYKGKKLAWVTFSSTRSYGLRINNSGQQDCYPTENPSDQKDAPAGVYPDFPNNTSCARSQLWMTAIDLDTGAVAAGQDVSHPAFWLPFQDRTTQNHLGQWTQKNFKGACGGDAGTCAAGYVCDNGGCAAIPPASTAPTPPPECTQDVQCKTGSCCAAGACGACTDAGAQVACNTCLDCGGQACTSTGCGACTSSSDCCAPLVCSQGSCVAPVIVK